MAFAIRAAREIDDSVDSIGIGFYAGLEADSESGVVIDRDYLTRQGFEGEAGQSQVFNSAGRNVVVLGLGTRGDVTADTYRRAAAQFIKSVAKSTHVALSLSGDAQAIAEGLVLGSYSFGKYKSKPKISNVEIVDVVTSNDGDLRRGEAIAQAVCLARDLINEPASDMTPTRLGEIAAEVGERTGLRTEIWDKARAEQERLGGLLGVARGSDQEPRLVRMFYEPEGAERTIVLVGKGITFDSGGLSLKPPDGMMTMKTDMSGAAAVIATMSVLSAISPNVRVVGIAAASENLPGPSATKPGDVLRARNGKTMEVLNTDAEGRLVLADGLSLAAEENPDAIVDVATLTGACKVALGGLIAGAFGNNADLTKRVLAAAESVGEPVWQLPMHKPYRKLIDSDIADIKNIGDAGGPGATTAAMFLQEFVSDKPWVHLDIAGPARSDKDDAYISKGGTGFGVRTLVELIKGF